MQIKHHKGRELKKILVPDIQSHLGFYALEYFFTIYDHKNYFLLYDDDGKIIGQLTYHKNRNRFLLATISITANHKNSGYSKLLLNEYFGLLKQHKAREFLTTLYSEEGEMCLDRMISMFCDANDMGFKFEEEAKFEPSNSRSPRM